RTAPSANSQTLIPSAVFNGRSRQSTVDRPKSIGKKSTVDSTQSTVRSQSKIQNPKSSLTGGPRPAPPEEVDRDACQDDRVARPGCPGIALEEDRDERGAGRGV